MIKGKEVLAIVPARLGSKRIKNKSLIKIKNNMRLLNYTFKSIINSKYIDDFVLSSESSKIINVSKKIGFNNCIQRPKNLASNKSKSEDVISHALKKIKKKYNIIILLQITSPLRTTSDIDKALEKFIKKKYTSMVSISKSTRKNKFNISLNRKDFVKKDFLSKKSKKYYHFLNGAIYIFKLDFFKKTKNFFSSETGYYLMPYRRSLDIDTNYDLKRLRSMLA